MLKVLVVDDMPLNRRILVAMLRRTNSRIDEAAGGQEAVELMCQHDYDLVFMDLMMPEMDGLEAARRIRANAKRARRPMIVAVTAADTEVMRRDSELAGLDGFLAKPVRYEDILQVVGACFASLSEAPAGASTHRPILFERDELLRRIGGDGQLAVLMAREFLDQAGSVLAAGRAAVDRGDARGFYEQVAALADLTMYFSSSVSAVATSLCNRAQTRALSDATASFETLSGKVERLAGELACFVDDPRGPLSLPSCARPAGHVCPGPGYPCPGGERTRRVRLDAGPARQGERDG